MDKLEEVKKIKQLLDDGIIDEEDFKNKKAQILGIESEDVEAEPKENKIKSKSLDDYERELLEQSEVEEKSTTKANDDYYQKEKLKARAKLDAAEEIRSKRKAEQKTAVDKGVNKIKRILKWALTVLLWIFAVGSFCTSDSGIVYIPIGLLSLILGCMACPKITDKTQKYETYTMHKTVIVWILVILLFVVMTVFPTNKNDIENNNDNSKQTNINENNQ